MPTRYDDDEDSSPAGGEREISLGTGTVLGIFLALALVCSLFFGLGYSMGRKSAPSTPASPVSAAEPSSLTPTGTDKPSPGSSISRTPRSDLQVTQPDDQETPGAGSSPTDRPASHAPVSRTTPPAETATPVPVPNTSALSPYVQVAAVSRKEDADLLLAALRKRGYAGIVRPQTQDKLLHIQVGPFATKKDAEAMRQRLITDGYNPILK